MAAVDDLLRATGIDLVQTLRTQISSWDRPQVPLGAHLIVIAVLPKQRKQDGQVEIVEWWAFLFGKPLSELGQALGLWEMRGGAPGHILGGKADRGLLTAIGVDVLNPTFELTRTSAALLNGVEPSEMKITAIGMGTLGSQIADNLVRSGFGTWTGIDPDYLLPHNVARHEMTSAEVGANKVEGMQFRLNSVFREKAMPATIVADVLHAAENGEKIEEAFKSAEVIIDFSANQALGRHLANGTDTVRRCSVFLNPSGTDLVVLCEDKTRTKRLDWLEFQYYRKLIGEPKLQGHFEASEGPIRYARSCRDLTSRVPQHLVSMHSGIAAGVLNRVLRADDAFVGIWASDRNMSVESFEAETFAPQAHSANAWRVLTDDQLLGKIAALRQEKSRKETGGVLIGACDHRHKVIYLVDTIPSPPDSVEWPTLYIRGCEGLKVAADSIGAATDGQMQYIGEWHSHPDGYATDPSKDDRQVFAWLAEHLARDGNPSVMMIAGEQDSRLFLNSMENPITILARGHLATAKADSSSNREALFCNQADDQLLG